MKVTIGALWRAFAVACVIVFGLTGCMTSASESTTLGPHRCDQPATASPSTPTVAVLGELGNTTDYYAGDLKTLVTDAVGLKARVMVSGVGSNGSAPSLVANTVLTGDGPNPMERTHSLECKEALVQKVFSQTLHERPTPQPLDDIAALKTLEGNLAGTPKGVPMNVVLFTSLLNTALPDDLEAPGALNNPAVELNTLAAQRLLPDCTGWRVYAIGGDQQSRPPLDNATGAGLREFWRQYFQRCGGALVAWSTHLDAFPISGGPIAPADTKQLPVHQEPGKVVADLAGDVLFDPGRDELRPTASDQLEQVLQLVNQSSGQVVVDGYTDVGGNEADNVDLSQRRCQSIQAWLVQHGVSPTRIAVNGHGSSNPRFAHPVTDEEHQADRRVEVTIYG